MSQPPAVHSDAGTLAHIGLATSRRPPGPVRVAGPVGALVAGADVGAAPGVVVPGAGSPPDPPGAGPVDGLLDGLLGAPADDVGLLVAVGDPGTA